MRLVVARLNPDYSNTWPSAILSSSVPEGFQFSSPGRVAFFLSLPSPSPTPSLSVRFFPPSMDSICVSSRIIGILRGWGRRERERGPRLARPSELLEIGSRAESCWKRTVDKDESLILSVVSRSFFFPDRRIRSITRGYKIGKCAKTASILNFR